MDLMDPLQLLKADFQDEDYETVIASANRLHVIAAALGSKRTKGELLPYLMDYATSTDNDEALTAIGKQLGDFVKYLGGPQHARLLLPLLQRLCGEEEVVVRQAAAASLNKLSGQMSKADIIGQMLPVFKDLSAGDWFTTRMSACSLVAPMYPALPEREQGQLRSQFQNLCNDETPMVRRAAHQEIPALTKHMHLNHIKSDILPLVTQISRDDMDSMRLLAIDAVVALVPKFGATFGAGKDDHLLPLIDAISDDTSWRVRVALAKAMPACCAAAPPRVAVRRLLPLYCRALQDKEGEVRAGAAGVLAEVCATVKTGIMENVQPLLMALADDPLQKVRVELSKCVVKLAPLVGRDNAQAMLVPLVQKLSKDEHHQVRNNIVQHIELMGEHLLGAVLPALVELGKDPKWRVRMAVIAKSGLLARHLGPKAFEHKIQQIIIMSLSDHVYAIRERSCGMIGDIVKLFGGKWASDKFFPSAFSIYDKNTNYLHRMTCLLVVSNVAKHCSGSVTEKDLLPIVASACIDDVPNVRIAAAKSMGDIIPRLDKTLVKGKCRKLLERMLNDTDKDVRYFASQSIKLC